MITTLLRKLEKVKSTGEHRWMACCPAHEDKSPSLALTETRDGKILMHCFAGCAPAAILAMLGMELGDLFPEPYERRGLYHDKSLDHEKMILYICECDRENGKRHSKQDLKREREAYLKVRNHNKGVWHESFNR